VRSILIATQLSFAINFRVGAVALVIEHRLGLGLDLGAGEQYLLRTHTYV
jgi:hypothetical protein